MLLTDLHVLQHVVSDDGEVVAALDGEVHHEHVIHEIVVQGSVLRHGTVQAPHVKGDNSAAGRPAQVVHDVGAWRNTQ